MQFTEWGEALKFCRKQRGFKLHHIADKFGTNASKVDDMERGYSHPSKMQLQNLYTFLPQMRRYENLVKQTGADPARTPPKAPELKSVPVPNKVEPAVVAKAANPLAAFGGAIRRVREAAKMNQGDIAKLCGMGQSVLSRMERGELPLTLSDYATIVDLFPSLKDEPRPYLRPARHSKSNNVIAPPVVAAKPETVTPAPAPEVVPEAPKTDTANPIALFMDIEERRKRQNEYVRELQAQMAEASKALEELEREAQDTMRDAFLFMAKASQAVG